MCHVQLRLLSVFSYGPSIVFMLFLYNLHSCNAISHSAFSRDDVSGTRMNVPPFYATTVLANGRTLRR